MFDISQEEDYRELTLEEQYLVNGGAEVANTNEAVANSKPGDTVTRDDKTTHVITQGDINWAKEHCGSNTGGAGNGNTGQPSYGSGGPSGESGGASSTIPKGTEGSISNSSNTSKANYTIDDKNKIISADINDPEGIMEAYSRYYMLSDRGYAFEIKDGKNHVHTFSDSKYVENYVRSIEKNVKSSEGMTTLDFIREASSNVSNTTGFLGSFAEIESKLSINADMAAKLGKSAKRLNTTASITGGITTVIDIHNFGEKPTLKNAMNLASDGVGFIPVYGPSLSIATNAVTEAINTTANACLDVWHPILRREQIINGFKNSYSDSQVLGFGVSDIDVKSAFYNCCRFFFGD